MNIPVISVKFLSVHQQSSRNCSGESDCKNELTWIVTFFQNSNGKNKIECFPLYSLLLAMDAKKIDFLSLGNSSNSEISINR